MPAKCSASDAKIHKSRAVKRPQIDSHNFSGPGLAVHRLVARPQPVRSAPKHSTRSTHGSFTTQCNNDKRPRVTETLPLGPISTINFDIPPSDGRTSGGRRSTPTQFQFIHLFPNIALSVHNSLLQCARVSHGNVTHVMGRRPAAVKRLHTNAPTPPLDGLQWNSCWAEELFSHTQFHAVYAMAKSKFGMY